MRPVTVLLLMLIVACGASTQEAAKLRTRYNLDYDSNTYPQTTPKEALASVIQAIGNKRVDYLLAHLSDPGFVDNQVREVYGGKFDEMVRAVKTKLANDPDTFKLLQRFAREGEWETAENAASVKLKDLRERVYFRRVDIRWFMENRRFPEKEKEKEKEKDGK